MFTVSRLLILLGAALILLCSACGGGTDDASSANATVSVPSAEATSESTVEAPSAASSGLPINSQGIEIVAKVNEQEITLPEFQRSLARREQGTTAADYEALAASELDTMIEQLLIEQGAAQMGLTVTDAAIEEEFQANRAQVADDAVWNQWLTANLFSEDEFRAMLQSALLTRAVRDTLSTQAASEVTQVHARHILVNTQAEAEAVLARLQSGEDFGALAAEVSNDVTTKDSGGDLGWFIREDLPFTPELADVALQLQPGQIAGPIPTQLGYHIIQTLEVGQREAEPDEQAVLVEAQFNTWLQTLLDSATIERYLN